MVQIIVEIDASPRRAIEVISWALHEHNKVLRKAVPDASVSYDVLGMHRTRCTGSDVEVGSDSRE